MPLLYPVPNGLDAYRAGGRLAQVGEETACRCCRLYLITMDAVGFGGQVLVTQPSEIRHLAQKGVQEQHHQLLRLGQRKGFPRRVGRTTGIHAVGLV
jgi:hypothetical protein